MTLFRLVTVSQHQTSSSSINTGKVLLIIRKNLEEPKYTLLRLSNEVKAYIVDKLYGIASHHGVEVIPTVFTGQGKRGDYNWHIGQFQSGKDDY